MKLIDKDALLAEIERLVNNYDKALDYEAALEDVRNFIDSIQEEPKKCMYTKDNYTDNDRKTLCDGCEEKCEYAQKEEPVSVELEEAANNALNNVLNAHEIVNVRSCLEMFKYGAKWQREKEYTCYEEAFEDGAKWKVENLWKPADGDDLPEIDREVIAILDYDFGHYKVVYAHRPNPNGWNGTNIDTGEKEHFEPVIYDKGGWNQPHVLYWLDARLPYEENKIDK